MEIKPSKCDSLYGFCVVAVAVATIWYGVLRWRSPPTPTVAATERHPAPAQVANKSSGRGKSVEEILASLPPKPLLIGTEFEERLREYAHYSYPAGSLKHRLGEPFIKRKQASRTAREAIFQRDGHQCLLCGSSDSLELDHMRALMNGGDNSLDNLSTLCAACNKSAMKRVDNKIKKQRKKLLDKPGRDASSLTSPNRNDIIVEHLIIFDAIAEGVRESVPN